MKIKASAWSYVKDHKTGKSVTVRFNDSEFAVIYDSPKPCVHTVDPDSRDTPEWEVPSIFQIKNLEIDFPFIKNLPPTFPSLMVASEILLGRIGK